MDITGPFPRLLIHGHCMSNCLMVHSHTPAICSWTHYWIHLNTCLIYGYWMTMLMWRNLVYVLTVVSCTHKACLLCQWSVWCVYRLINFIVQNIDLHCHRLQCQCPSHHLKQQRNGLRSRWVNSSPTSVAYMRRWTVSALVRVMAFRLLRAKSLPEPLMIYCQMDLQEHTSVKFEWKYKTFHSWKCIWICCLQKLAALLSRGSWVKICFSLL